MYATITVHPEQSINLMFGFPKVPEITAEEVKQSLDTNKEVVLLDVRTSEEFIKGNIQKSINLPVDDIAEKVETMLKDKQATIYVYCLSGSRSTVTVDTMIKLGYTHVFSLTSGLLAWRAKKFPLITES